MTSLFSKIENNQRQSLKKRLEVTIDPVARQQLLRYIAGLNSAWAVIKPLTGKDGLLKSYIGDLEGWDLYSPVELVQVVRRRRVEALSPRPLFPGYLFVRPPVGEHSRVMDLRYCMKVLHVVVFDGMLRSIERQEQAAHEEVRQTEKKARTKREPRVIRSFSDLAQAIQEEPVDEDRATLLLKHRKMLPGCAGLLEDYFDTDELPASVSAEAIQGRQLHFQ
jgi:hypothetical protein